MSIAITIVVVILVAYGMLKQYNPQAVLLTAGIILFISSYYLLGVSPVEPDKSKGFLIFDVWEKFSEVTNNRLAAVGLTLVSIAGVATYLNKIGASAALIKVTSSLVMRVSNPYILLYLVLIMVSVLYIFITGATSISLLLMGTLYPLLRNAGISAKTMAATIIIPTAWEYGPGQMNANIGAVSINTNIMDFVIYHQTPLQIIIVITIAFINIVWQKFLDKKDGFDYSKDRGKYLKTLNEENSNSVNAPKYYALFPIIPFILLIGFSGLFSDKHKITIPIAMMSTICICIIIESIRYRSIKEAFANFKSWLTGTGTIFATVITLMLAAEFFANGLDNIGAISALISAAEKFSLPPFGLSLVFCLFILFTAFITGSGNAAVMAFISIVPTVATQFNVSPLLILIPILFAAGVGRTISPVAGAIITVAGIAKLTPFDIVKRTSVPALCSLIIAIVYAIVRYS